QPEAALLVLDQPLVLEVTDEVMRIRVAHARVTALRAAGHGPEADALEATLPVPEPEEEDVVFAVLEAPSEPGAGTAEASEESTNPEPRAAQQREDDRIDG